MSKAWTEGFCNETTGFLFRHECLQPASARCSVCGKPLCPEHVRVFNDGGTACPSCAHDATRDVGEVDHWDDSRRYYPGYGVYGGGGWGTHSHGHFHDHDSHNPATGAHDPNDLTPADAESLEVEGDEEFETDMGAS